MIAVGFPGVGLSPRTTGVTCLKGEGHGGFQSTTSGEVSADGCLEAACESRLPGALARPLAPSCGEAQVAGVQPTSCTAELRCLSPPLSLPFFLSLPRRLFLSLKDALLTPFLLYHRHTCSDVHMAVPLSPMFLQAPSGVAILNG